MHKASAGMPPVLIALLIAALGAGTASADAPAFPDATLSRLPNGVVVVRQAARSFPVVGAQIVVPAGLSQQPPDRPGLAALTAAMVLRTPVEGTTTLADVVKRRGGTIDYFLEPLDTRYYVEMRAGDEQRIVHDVAVALQRPADSALEPARRELMDEAKAHVPAPPETVYRLVRQVEYRGTGYVGAESGDSLTLPGLTLAEASSFAASYRHGDGTVIALSGDVTQASTDAALRAFQSWPAGSNPAPQPSALRRSTRVEAQRPVGAPWLGVAYLAPTEFSHDFAAMLVIQALIGREGEAAFSFEPAGRVPAGYAGSYYQFDAKPATLVLFVSGGATENLDQSLRAVEDGISLLRKRALPANTIAAARRIAAGSFLTSIATLDDASWLLARAAASPAGVRSENDLARSIARVSAQDVQRVAQTFLSRETVALVTPSIGL